VFAFAALTFATPVKDQIPKSISAGTLPLSRRRRGPKSSSSAMRDRASSINSVSEVTCARRLAASRSLAETLPESLASLASPNRPAALACSSTRLFRRCAATSSS
jgi:hypothetical protein